MTNAANINVSAILGTSLKGVLTEAQFREVMTVLAGRAGGDLLAAPKVTTLSGRPAQIQAVDLRTVVTGFSPDAPKASGAAQTTNGLSLTRARIPVGPMLDINPIVAADGHTIELTVIPTVTEFLGYDEPAAGAGVAAQTGEGAKQIAVPMPRFRVRQMQTQAQIEDGQTLVLGGFPVEETRRIKDKASAPDDIPFTGQRFRSKPWPSVRKTLLVFVTATIVDAAGNRIHPAGPPGSGQRP